MARIVGVDIPNDKPVGIALTYIYGIGRYTAELICEKAKLILPSSERFNRRSIRRSP